MDRKTFLKKSVQVGLGSSGMFLFAKGGASAQTTDAHMKREQKFKEDWVKALMENLEDQFDEEARIKLMETCGRGCAKRGAIQIAEACKGDVDKMVKILSRIPDLEIEKKDDNEYLVTYGKCFCELVSKGPERLPDAYCECSRGWLLQMFGTAAEKPVEVKILQTVKRGADACKFVVTI